MRSLCTLITACVLAFGQTPQRQANSPEPPQPEVKPEDKCTLEGTVVDLFSGQPLKKAHLNLNLLSGADTVSFGADTDAAGHFLLTDVDPGRYFFIASRNGYINQTYSPQGGLKRNAPVTLGKGEKLKDIVFKMTPQAVISGRVLDQDGDPLARVQVQALTFAYRRGKKQLVPMGNGSTDDLGEFRMFGLRPGRYLISVNYRPFNPYVASTERLAGPALDEGYSTLYYPNSSDPGGASQIEVAAGAQIPGITMTLAPRRTVRVKGRVISGLAPHQRGNVTLALMPRSTNVLWFMMRNITRVLDSNGNFEFRGVSPGSYNLWGNYIEDDLLYDARIPIEVQDTNIAGIELSFHPAASINGRVVVEDNGDLKGATLYAQLQPRLEEMSQAGSGGQVKNDLSFKLQNVTQDIFNITLSGLPEAFYLKTIRFGDQDVTLTGLDFTQGIPAGEVRVVVNPNGGQVEGDIENAKGEAAAGVVVTLIPNDSARATSWLYKSANTDQNGHFLIKGVRPGEYKIYAWEEIENGAYLDPDYAKPYESFGKSVSIKENGHENLHLTSITADDAARAATAR